MKALLLSAGFGKRLGSITKIQPKCLVKVKGTPILEIWIEKLYQLNIEEIFINTHYLSEQVENFLKRYHNQNIKITILKEKKLLGTAGTLYKNLHLFNKSELLLAHTDNYFEENLSNLINAYKKRPKMCDLTMMTFDTPNPSSCGIVEVDKNNIVNKYTEKPKFSYSSKANCAIFVLSENFLNNFTKKSYEKDFCKDILPKFINKIYTYHTKKIFLDIGTKKSLNKINEMD